MRTAAICPTCATYFNAVCVLYDGPTTLTNIPASPNDDLDTILVALNTTIGTINTTVGGLSSNKVPYTGATGNVNLGAFNISANSFIKNGGLSTQFLKANGSIDSNIYLTTASAATIYVPYTGATGNVDLGLNDITATDVTVNGILYVNDDLNANGSSGNLGDLLVSQGPGSAPQWQAPPTVYKVYTAVISQSGLIAPTVDYELDNTLGFVPTFTYSSVGKYNIVAPALDWVTNKVIVFINPGFPGLGVITGWERNSSTLLTIHTQTPNPINPFDPWEDGLLNKASIEIRIYT
jgi:hypothetical protein